MLHADTAKSLAGAAAALGALGLRTKLADTSPRARQLRIHIHQDHKVGPYPSSHRIDDRTHLVQFETTTIVPEDFVGIEIAVSENQAAFCQGRLNALGEELCISGHVHQELRQRPERDVARVLSELAHPTHKR